jgi:4-hydroxythreonine-4-phosphate dehydrogenase
MMISDYRPIIGITMGDPVGIGPEIILSSLITPWIYEVCRPLVIGDSRILGAAKKIIRSRLEIESVKTPDAGTYKCGTIDVLNISELDPDKTTWGKPTVQSSGAMVRYITAAADLAIRQHIEAMVTCPINKMAMQLSGFHYSGHTELLAERTQSKEFAMMLAGERLRVVLVTIHVPLKDVPAGLSRQKIVKTIKLTWQALNERFGIKAPRIAVSGLNPHAGEGGMFGDEEKNIIAPAIRDAGNQGVFASGPFPPDTVFYHAANQHFDAVVSMYHDQGLIPFKLIHFNNGVNTTIGLPIIRTSVDHGTAYDIAGSGIADPGSLMAAINMAAQQAVSARNRNHFH